MVQFESSVCSTTKVGSCQSSPRVANFVSNYESPNPSGVRDMTIFFSENSVNIIEKT